jgi:glutamine amidotransferase
MCELFAMCSRFPAAVDICLDELARHGGQTGPHRDGWGISYYAEDGAVQLYKEAEPATGSDWVHFIQEHHLRSTVVISHIRCASQGGRSLKNTQPFRRELGGKCHVFAHNGDLVDIKADPNFRLGIHRPIGETDSEHAFCALLAQLEQAWLLTSDVPPLKQRLAIVVRFARGLRRLGMANFTYSDGDAVFVHGNRRRCTPSEAPRPPGLLVLRRGWGMDSDGQCIDDRPIVTRSEWQEMVLVASVPLTSEAWRPLGEGEVLALRGGRIVARVSSDGSSGRMLRKTIASTGGRAMDVATIKKEIDRLSKDEKSKILTEVMPALCRELLGDQACRGKAMEAFGIDCVEELEAKLEYMI